MFKKEEHQLRFCATLKFDRPALEHHTKVLEALDQDYYEKGKAAVIRKYLNYCYITYKDEVMQWRLRAINFNMTQQEQRGIFKVKLQFRKGAELTHCKFLSENDDGSGILTTDYDSLGTKVDSLPPILDPYKELEVSRNDHIKAQKKR